MEIFDFRNKSFMKTSCEVFLVSSEKFSVNLRKEKRNEWHMKRRHQTLHLIEAERKNIIEALLEYLPHTFTRQLKLALEQKEETLNLVLLELSKYSHCLNFDHHAVLDFFYCLSKSSEECELIFKLNLIEPLIDLVGPSVDSSEILKLLLEIIENYPDGAIELIHQGLIEQIKTFLNLDPKALEVCSYAIYRLVALSEKKLEPATLAIIANLCKWQMKTGNETIKLYVYHTINYLLQVKNYETLCEFICKKVVSDLKNPQYQRILLEISINLTTGHEKLANKLIMLDILNGLNEILKASPNFTAKVVHILGNLADSSSSSKSKIIIHPIFKKIAALVNSPLREVQKQVSYFYLHLSLNANYMQVSQFLNPELFVRISDVLGSSLEISKNFLMFFFNVLKKKMFLEKVRKGFEESGCLEKVEKIANNDGLSLEAGYVLKKFENYWG